MSDVQQESLLDLSIQRTIMLHDRGRAFTIICRRVEPGDWLSYFSSISLTSEQRDGKRVSMMDYDTPLVQLAEAVVVGAEGYAVEGGGELADLPDWQSRLPLAHRRQVGSTLQNVRVSASADDFCIRQLGEEVSLDAVWSLDGSTGKMAGYQGLKHIFKTPTQAQFKRYNQEASRSVVVGGSRTGRTIYTGAQAVLCELYDELILSVEGYVFGDKLLTDPQTIRNCMDLHHKFTAAQELFNPSSTVTTEAASNE